MIFDEKSHELPVAITKLISNGADTQKKCYS
jgi:hypothetical protein